MKKIILLHMLFLFAGAVTACPMCSSPRAVQVRNYLFGPELFFNVLALLLPFLIFTAVSIYIYHYDLPFNKNKRI